MKCNLCKKECIESELLNGICYDCLEKKYENKEPEKNVIEDEKNSEIIDKYNNLSDIVLAIGILFGIICGIGIFIVLKDVFNSFITILLSIVGAGSIIVSAWYKSLILEGEAEKIKLLKQINNK